MKKGKGSKLISMILSGCLLGMGVGISAVSSVSAQTDHTSKMGKKKSGKHKKSSKTAYYHKKSR